MTAHQEELAFVVNLHSYGNQFIYPFNGRAKNDIEERRPGILPIFEKIAKEAPFMPDTKKGNAKEVIGETVGGDQDDWTLGELGIPSVTAEIGSELQFIHEWQAADSATAQNIVEEQSGWMEYIFDHLPEYQKAKQEAGAPKDAPATPKQ